MIIPYRSLLSTYCKVLVLFPLILVINMAAAQPNRPVDPRVELRSYYFEDTDEELSYAVYVSSKVSRDSKSPLIIALHGRGGQPTAIVRKSSIDLAEAGGYILVGPMGYNPFGWYGSRVGEVNREGNPIVSVEIAEYSEKDVMNVLEIIRNDYNVDENRTYLMGHSMGGAGTFYLGSKYGPNWAAIAATAPASGPMDKTMLDQIKNTVPILVTHGGADNRVPVENTRGWIEYMRENEINHAYLEISEAGHGNILDLSMSTIFSFFEAHTRTPH